MFDLLFTKCPSVSQSAAMHSIKETVAEDTSHFFGSVRSLFGFKVNPLAPNPLGPYGRVLGGSVSL